MPIAVSLLKLGVSYAFNLAYREIWVLRADLHVAQRISSFSLSLRYNVLMTGFHAACVNLGVIPEGEWICPTCDQTAGARERRKIVMEKTRRTVIAVGGANEAVADAAASQVVMASSEAFARAARARFREIVSSTGLFGPANTATNAAGATLDACVDNFALTLERT